MFNTKEGGREQWEVEDKRGGQYISYTQAQFNMDID